MHVNAVVPKISEAIAASEAQLVERLDRIEALLVQLVAEGRKPEFGPATTPTPSRSKART